MRDHIVETINKLFVYTDHLKWEKLKSEVFTENVFLDMSSMGMEASETSAQAICEMWKVGFEGIDTVNHLAGNYLVEVAGDTATAFCYATATHFKEKTTKGKTREFVGSYEFTLDLTESGWRISKMKYNLRYMNGNINFE